MKEHPNNNTVIINIRDYMTIWQFVTLIFLILSESLDYYIINWVIKSRESERERERERERNELIKWMLGYLNLVSSHVLFLFYLIWMNYKMKVFEPFLFHF